MITALIIMHFFGGGAPEIFSRSDFKTVERSIEDVERSEPVTEAMDRMNARFVSNLKMRARSFEKLSEIDYNVNSREAAYDAIFDELEQARAEASKKYIEDIFAMRENMTRDEWHDAFGDAE